jgi:hypothetical protein
MIQPDATGYSCYGGVDYKSVVWQKISVTRYGSILEAGRLIIRLSTTSDSINSEAKGI